MLDYASNESENLKLEKSGVASAGMALLLIHFEPAISGVRNSTGGVPVPWFYYGGF